MKIACIGEAMVELSLAKGSHAAQLGFAGDTLNTAIYLKRLQPNWDISYVSRVGQDDLSDQMLVYMASEGLNTDPVGRCATSSVGLYAISTDAHGERSFAYWRGQSAARDCFSTSTPSLDDLAQFDVIYLSAISLAILPASMRQALWDQLQALRKSGVRVCFDSNFRPKLWEDHAAAQQWISKFWQITDIALPSVDDEQAAFGDADADAVMARLAGYGVTAGAMKCGPTGPRSWSEDGGDQTYPVVTHVVDTTAAGDSFNAGFLAQYLADGDTMAAMMQGHTLASRVIGVKGAIIPKSTETPDD
jgi:2-dehydro-3-deoxygluconokinase